MLVPSEVCASQHASLLKWLQVEDDGSCHVTLQITLTASTQLNPTVLIQNLDVVM